jgi:hypothetical protein
VVVYGAMAATRRVYASDTLETLPRRLRIRSQNRQPCRSVKLLFNENLSRKLVQRLADPYPGSVHEVGVDLLKSPDCDIWDFAKVIRFTIVSTDLDFFDLAAAGRRRK